MSLISQIFGNFKQTVAEPPLPPFTAAAAKNFFIAFLAELGNLESFETMLFFSKIFPLITNPAGGLLKFTLIKVYLKFSASPLLLKILEPNLF